MRETFGLTIDQMAGFNDTVNHISNTVSAKAPQLFEFTNRASGAAEFLGLTVDQLAGLGGSLIASGVAAETAGRGVTALATRLRTGAKGVDENLAKIGLSREKFLSMLDADGDAAMVELFTRMSKLDLNAQATALKALVGQDFSDDFVKLLQRPELLKETFDLANDPGKSGSAQQEAAVRAETLNAKIQLLQNSFFRLNKSIGDTLMGALKRTMERIGRIADAVARWVDENPKLTAGLIKATGGLIAFNLAFASTNLVRLVLWGGALRTAAAGLRAEIAAIQKEIRNTQPGRGGDAKIAALKEDMAPLKARLGEVEGKIADAVQTAGRLQAAMLALANANVSPKVDDTSIRRAQEKAERLRSTLQGVNTGATANANSKPVDGERAGGGPVRRGLSYLVGEEGPEIITPDRAGFVHTARETVRRQERVARQAERIRERANDLTRPSAAAVAPAARLGRAAAALTTGALIGTPVPVAAAPPVVQSVAAIQPAPAPVAAPSAPQFAEQGASRSAAARQNGPNSVSVTFTGDINVQAAANASAEEIGEEFGRQITARLRSQFSDEF